MHGNLKPLPNLNPPPPGQTCIETPLSCTSPWQLPAQEEYYGLCFLLTETLLLDIWCFWSVEEGCAWVGCHDDHLYISLICNYAIWCLPLPIPPKKWHLFLYMYMRTYVLHCNGLDMCVKSWQCLSFYFSACREIQVDDNGVKMAKGSLCWSQTTKHPNVPSRH